LERRIPWTVHHQEIIWVVRWRVRQAVLAEVGEELEAMEAGKTSGRDKEETDCSP